MLLRRADECLCRRQIRRFQAAQIKKKIPEAVSIFILPPDKKTLEWRLKNRSLDTQEVIQRRLLVATKEIENYQNYDYILVNDRLEQSIDELQAIVLSERLRRSGKVLSPAEDRVVATAERCRLSNVRGRLQPILSSFALSATPS